MARRFNASPPGDQNIQTVRQFRELQDYLANLEERLLPVYGRADIDPIALINDPVNWVPLVLSNPSPALPEALPATYVISARVDVSGSTNNAWIQARATWEDREGPQEFIGAVYDIGNNARISVTNSAIVATGFNLQFWLRGEDAELISGKITMHQIGSGGFQIR